MEGRMVFFCKKRNGPECFDVLGASLGAGTQCWKFACLVRAEEARTRSSRHRSPKIAHPSQRNCIKPKDITSSPWIPENLPGGRSSSFLKKEPKNFCSFGPSLSGKAEAKTDSSFLLLFSKKKTFFRNHIRVSKQTG
jgi:hypothetical protein